MKQKIRRSRTRSKRPEEGARITPSCCLMDRAMSEATIEPAQGSAWRKSEKR
jgi:hypothetical protein